MLELKGITKDYASGENVVHALKGISVTFRDREFVSILGQSGCGKTTLLNIIGGLDPVHARRPCHQRSLHQELSRPRLGTRIATIPWVSSSKL